MEVQHDDAPWGTLGTGTNSAGKAEILVQIASQLDGVNPRCTCGSAMKKKYSSPVFRYLDFLQVDDETVAEPIPRHQKED